MEEPEGLSRELAERMSRAENLAADPSLLRALDIAARDDGLWRQAEENPEGFLGEYGVQIPEGLQLRFVRDPGDYPWPDYEFFTIRLTRCRSYWVKKKNEPGYEQVTICFGFEIVPYPISPIG